MQIIFVSSVSIRSLMSSTFYTILDKLLYNAESLVIIIVINLYVLLNFSYSE